MRTILNRFVSLKQGQNQLNSLKFISLIFLLAMLFCDQQAMAQTASSDTVVNDQMNRWLFIGLSLIFLGIVVYHISSALTVLHENGRSVEFKFPMVRNMAHNGTTVGVLILILVLAGIIWAVTFGG